MSQSSSRKSIRPKNPCRYIGKPGAESGAAGRGEELNRITYVDHLDRSVLRAPFKKFEGQKIRIKVVQCWIKVFTIGGDRAEASSQTES